MLQSLRLQLFLGILVILVGAGGVIMVSTQQEVEQALIDAENRSARNILNLIEINVSSRYRELLMEKVRIVQERRQNLEQLNRVISDTMEDYRSLAETGVLTEEQARNRALRWLSNLNLEGGLTAFAANSVGAIVAHPATAMIGVNLGEFQDLKGRTLIEAVRGEIENWGSTFVTYEEDGLDPQDDGRRFAHFMPMEAFDLYHGISDNIEDVERYVEEGVEATIEVLADTVGRVQVVDTGFVFIFDGNLDSVIAPPERADNIMTAATPNDGLPLLERLREAGAADDGRAVRYTLDIAGQPSEMEAYVSYFRPLSWYIVSTVPTAEIARPATMLVQRQIAIFAVVLAVSLLLAWIFAYKLTSPLQRLTAYARELPDHDFTTKRETDSALEELTRRSKSEVGGLARAFMFMEGSLRENIRQLLDTTKAKERIESELNIAQEIQRGLLPKIFPPFPECPQIDLHAALRPARHVGGDLFDFYFIDENRLCFTVGDVADKGVPSALFMAITKTLVKSASSQDTDPGAMMERVNNDLSVDNPNAMFVTLLIAVLDIRTGVVEYANAGHNPPIVVSGKTGEAYFENGISGPAAGAMEQMTYPKKTMQLEPGDMLVLYTDGITEAMDIANNEYGSDRLLDLCVSIGDRSAAEMVGTIVEDVSSHTGDAMQSDDITILCLRWEKAQSGTSAAVA